MKLFSFFRPASSAPVARERLQILLEYERKLGSHVDLIAVLREEILEVLSRHVNVDPPRSRSPSTGPPTSRRLPSTSKSRTHPAGCGRGHEADRTRTIGSHGIAGPAEITSCC
jgi:cell division topological specificity factor MinE